ADGTPIINPRTGKQQKRCPQYWYDTPDHKKPPGARKLLIHLPRLLEAIAAGKDIYIVEDEPKAALLHNWKYVGTCAPEGAGHWYPEHAELLRGAKCVIILPDNDEEGRKHADTIARSLMGIVPEIHLGELPNLPEHGDIVDWYGYGGTQEQFAELPTRPWSSNYPPEQEGKLEIEEIEIRPGTVDIYNVKVRSSGVVPVGAEQLNYFPWFNRACITYLQRAFDPPKSPTAWSKQVDTALRGAKRIVSPAEALHIHGTDSWGDEEVEWILNEAIRPNGVGVLSGPYGIFKTFILLDACASVMTGLPFLAKQVRRRCGVLIFAPEGANTIRLRLRALIEHKLAKANLTSRDLLNQRGIDLEHLPFAFVGDCRPLLDPRTVDWIIGHAQHAQDHFRAMHGVDLGLIGYDTLAAAAGWDNENDAAQAQ